MQMAGKLPDTSAESFRTILERFCIVVVFSIAFAYIEAAVVVYLRTIFYPAGFTFPLAEFGLSPLWRQLLLTEIGREVATLVLIFTASWLFGRDHQQRVAYFLAIFAVWDIFYYVWLKILINWPCSVMDWDILFLIPYPWASPVLAPVIVSIILLSFAVIILYRSSRFKRFKTTRTDWFSFFGAAVVVVASFYIAGRYITEPDFRSHFYWLVFVVGCTFAVATFLNRLLKFR